MSFTGKQPIWYREPMVWLVIAIPLSSVAMGIALFVLAVSTNDGLVTDDYYKKGLQINRSMERDELATSYNLTGDVALGSPGEAVEVVLSGNTRFHAPETVNLRLFHATRSGLDRHLVLRRIDTGRYLASGPSLEAGNWYLQLDADGWRLVSRLSASDAPQRVSLGSQALP